ncbi:MAG TPA: DUF2948 family protein [Dongiaceae bacterium]|nr:DUF2948 family protein [Dongiaceae bacterium]
MMTTTTGLKLIARDAEDLAVVASCLQDALVPLNEMRYLAAERRFIMLVNRFRWERDKLRAKSVKQAVKQPVDASFEDESYPGAHQRIHSGLCIDRVLAVRSRDINRDRPDQFLDLLTMQYGDGKLDFLFSGGGVIQLEVEALNLFLQDLGEAWPTQWQPQHEAETADRAKSATDIGRR